MNCQVYISNEQHKYLKDFKTTAFETVVNETLLSWLVG